MTNRIAAAAMICVALAFGDLARGEAKWGSDVKAAMAQAQKEGKDLLFDFTGSDWCGWCIKLHEEVFSQEPFVTEAPKLFVLVTLDFPRKKLSAELTAQNRQWQQKLGVQGFPTIYLLDAQGRPYAELGYQEGGAKKYMETLNAKRQIRVRRDEALAAAAKASGLDKAKLLDKALSEIDPAVAVNFYRPTVDEIVKLDEGNKAGLSGKYELAVVMADVQKEMSAGKIKEALAKIDAAMTKLKATGQLAQDLLFLKAQALYGAKQLDESKKTLQEALKIAPEGNKVQMIKTVLERAFPAKEE
ncbi:MAG: thioredoxin family protein [Planctomycetaceae bacterium]|nr:thioredoxin family protein [Planctomycetaceae bacterium]